LTNINGKNYIQIKKIIYKIKKNYSSSWTDSCSLFFSSLLILLSSDSGELSQFDLAELLLSASLSLSIISTNFLFLAFSSARFRISLSGGNSGSGRSGVFGVSGAGAFLFWEKDGNWVFLFFEDDGGGEEEEQEEEEEEEDWESSDSDISNISFFFIFSYF
jgi:hypothetical protein